MFVGRRWQGSELASGPAPADRSERQRRGADGAQPGPSAAKDERSAKRVTASVRGTSRQPSPKRRPGAVGQDARGQAAEPWTAQPRFPRLTRHVDSPIRQPTPRHGPYGLHRAIAAPRITPPPRDAQAVCIVVCVLAKSNRLHECGLRKDWSSCLHRSRAIAAHPGAARNERSAWRRWTEAQVNGSGCLYWRGSEL